MQESATEPVGREPHRPNGEYAMPSGPEPVGMDATTVALGISIITTRELPWSATNAKRPSRDSVTPSGDGDPGNSAFAPTPSAGILTVARSWRVARSTMRTTALGGSVMITVRPSGVTASRYGIPKPDSVPADAPARGSRTVTVFAWLLPTQTCSPLGVTAIPSTAGARVNSRTNLRCGTSSSLTVPSATLLV